MVASSADAVASVTPSAKRPTTTSSRRSRGRVASSSPAGQCEAIGRERHPDPGAGHSPVHPAKRGAGHTNHLERAAGQANAATDNARIGCEAASPQRVAQHDHCRPLLVVNRLDHAAGGGANAQGQEILAIDRFGRHHLGRRSKRGGGLKPPGRGQAAEGCLRGPQVVEVRRRDRSPHHPAVVRRDHKCDPLGIRHAGIHEEQQVDDGVAGGCDRHAHSERGDGKDGEDGGREQAPCGVSKILGDSAGEGHRSPA